MNNISKFLASAAIVGMSVASSVGMASASSFHSVGGTSYVNSAGQMYGAGHNAYGYNNGTTAGSYHANAAYGPYANGYTYGTSYCTNGVSCSHTGAGYANTQYGPAYYNVNASAVNNGNGTYTVYYSGTTQKPGQAAVPHSGSFTR